MILKSWNLSLIMIAAYGVILISTFLSEYSCDFESDDYCNWKVEGNYEDFSFVRVTGKQVAESGSMQFPTSDHKGDNSTHFFGAERVK